VLVTAHPLEIGVQKGLIDLRAPQRIQTPRLPKIMEETIYRVAHSTEVSFKGSLVRALQRVSLEEALDFF
jgi:hypothetical protein